MARIIQVGQRLDPNITSYPEMTHYAWDPRNSVHHAFKVFAARPSGAEQTAFKRGGRLELAFFVEGPVILLLWSGAGWPWSDASYNWHLQRITECPSVDPLPPGAGVPIEFMLVDAADGRVVAMRHVAMPGAFALELQKAIASQVDQPFDAREYDAVLQRLMAHQTNALVARAQHRVRLA